MVFSNVLHNVVVVHWQNPVLAGIVYLAQLQHTIERAAILLLAEIGLKVKNKFGALIRKPYPRPNHKDTVWVSDALS